MYSEEAYLAFSKLQEGKHFLSGGTNFSLGDIALAVQGKDGIGGLIEEWFGVWAIRNGLNISRDLSAGTQEFPDYYVGNEKNLLEIKSFNAQAGANFDIANFQSYCSSIVDSPERLDADYLIFSYISYNGKLSISEIYLKKIWEITCPSDRWPLKTQTKRNVIYNIRPSSFSGRGIFQPFRSKAEFIAALFDTEEMYLGRRSENKDRFYQLHSDLLL